MESTTRSREGLAELGDLFKDESGKLWRAVFAFCRNEQIASDAVAEAFAQCLRRGEQVRDPRSWVWRAAFRIAAGQLKEGRESVQLSESLFIAAPEPADELLAALGALAPMQRAALLLHYYGGYDAGDVAKALGIARATVRVHLSRGRRRLRSLLEEPDD